MERSPARRARLTARPPLAEAAVAPHAPPDTGAIRVGISGWIYSPWRNTFYPPQLPHRRELEYASRCLRTLEINSTSYGSETPSTYARWASETPEDFVFSIRAPRQVTERGPLARTRMAVRAFVHGGLDALGPRLGPIVWQMPPNRAFDAADLTAFFELLPRTLQGMPLQHVVDSRNVGFRTTEYIELATRYGIASAQCDTDGPLDAGRVTGAIAYVRLMQARTGEAMGYAVDALQSHADELSRWVAPAATTASSTATSVYVYFAGGARQRDPAAAMALAEALAQRRASSH